MVVSRSLRFFLSPCSSVGKSSSICALSAIYVSAMMSTAVLSNAAVIDPNVDAEYPGTAVRRRNGIIERVKSLTEEDLSKDWREVRRKILWAGGLKDLEYAKPGYGYTGHSFNDWNHCDLTAMNDEKADNENDGSVQGIAIGNHLGTGIRIASEQSDDLGPGGSWSTCMMGCSKIRLRMLLTFNFVHVSRSSLYGYLPNSALSSSLETMEACSPALGLQRAISPTRLRDSATI